MIKTCLRQSRLNFIQKQYLETLFQLPTIAIILEKILQTSAKHSASLVFITSRSIKALLKLNRCQFELIKQKRFTSEYFTCFACSRRNKNDFASSLIYAVITVWPSNHQTSGTAKLPNNLSTPSRNIGTSATPPNKDICFAYGSYMVL
jgi:hypothetical protein